VKVEVTVGFSGVTVEEFEAEQFFFVHFMAEKMGVSASSITIIDVYIDDGSGRRLLAEDDLVVIFEVIAEEGVTPDDFEELLNLDPTAVIEWVQANINPNAELVLDITASEVKVTTSDVDDSSAATRTCVIHSFFAFMACMSLLCVN